jgi:hypothetical protein
VDRLANKTQQVSISRRNIKEPTNGLVPTGMSHPIICTNSQPILPILSQVIQANFLLKYLLKAVLRLSTYSGVPRGVVVGGLTLPLPKFRGFDKAELNYQFREKYIRKNLIRIRVSLIF